MHLTNLRVYFPPTTRGVQPASPRPCPNESAHDSQRVFGTGLEIPRLRSTSSQPVKIKNNNKKKRKMGKEGGKTQPLGFSPWLGCGALGDVPQPWPSVWCAGAWRSRVGVSTSSSGPAAGFGGDGGSAGCKGGLQPARRGLIKCEILALVSRALAWDAVGRKSLEGNNEN